MGRGTRYKYIGSGEGAVLHDAVLDSIENDHEFRTQVKDYLKQEEVQTLEFYGVPTTEMRDSIIPRHKLAKRLE